MQNQQVIEKIANLKGRRNYEEKKALKLGFTSLYDYFEDKIDKEKKEVEKKEIYLKKQVNKKELLKKSKLEKKKSCKCC